MEKGSRKPGGERDWNPLGLEKQSLSRSRGCRGEGNGTPLQCSCLDNPMDGGAWWAAVHGVAKLDTTERLHFHFSLSFIVEGNGNPLQGSCLENPREGGAWWAAVHGVAQSRTRLKRLSSSSKTILYSIFFPFFRSISFFKGEGKKSYRD